MVRVREYKTRRLADEASSYLMSKGIPAVIKGYVAVPKGLEHFKQDKVELMVPEHLYNKSIEYLSELERKVDNKKKEKE